MKKGKKNKFDVMSFAGTVTGAIVARVVTSKLPIQNNLVKNAVPVAIGAFLMNQRNPFMASAGTGMIAAGGSGLVASFIPGISGLLNTEVVNGVGEFDLTLDGVGAEDAPMLIDGVGMDVDFNSRIAGNDVINGTDEFIAGSDEFMA
jgi:hypothetical protein